MVTGVMVFLYRPDYGQLGNAARIGDGSLNGITSPARASGKVFVLFDEQVKHGNFTLEECLGNPEVVCLKVVRREIGVHGTYMHVEQIGRPKGWCMFGGNYVHTSDSRVASWAPYPLPVHDRFER